MIIGIEEFDNTKILIDTDVTNNITLNITLKRMINFIRNSS